MSDAARRDAALLTAVSAVVAFVALRSVVAIGGHRPLAIDVWWHDLMGAASSDVGIVIAWVPAVIGGTIGMILVGAALVVLLLWRGRRGDAVTLATAMVAVVAVGATMAAVIGRTRPADSLAESVATSFPSGHTAVATTVVVVLGIALRRRLVWVLGTIWVLTMMWSRTYLSAHWLSDVIAGMLEGIGVATLVWVCAEAVRDRHAARLSDTPPFEHSDESATTP
ncbi:phosphatase PAP2 family protein [Microbacterium sp. ANT_H45B]|uniref:phosphatase PAP2 family protein n=1 Tax=Microbacterium sp. ANT_H45B TaxID=2597346 RepID=UPI0011EED5DB|nr:phosphatase PAP2 family protein [Microbacterium sp. ANT_H45B]KAA0962572.1 phosphatase PAP2 family protein [Microbacterium sp. ANT_H45B]